MTDGMIGNRIECPDLIEPLIGFRLWHLFKGKLSSPHRLGVSWQPGQNHAACKSTFHQREKESLLQNFKLPLMGTGLYIKQSKKPKVVPTSQCHCGLYAYLEPQAGWEHLKGRQVAGAIKAWGRVELHETGFRAEFAEPVLLSFADHKVRDKYRLAEVAQKYGIEVVSYEELSERSKEWGKLWSPQT